MPTILEPWVWDETGRNYRIRHEIDGAFSDAVDAFDKAWDAYVGIRKFAGYYVGDFSPYWTSERNTDYLDARAAFHFGWQAGAVDAHRIQMERTQKEYEEYQRRVAERLNKFESVTIPPSMRWQNATRVAWRFYDAWIDIRFFTLRTPVIPEMSFTLEAELPSAYSNNFKDVWYFAIGERKASGPYEMLDEAKQECDFYMRRIYRP